MKCQEVMEYMQRYLDKDLKEAEIEYLNEHLKGCSECCDMFERLKQLSDELVLLPKVTPPISLVDSILPQLEHMDQIQADMSAKDNMIRNHRPVTAAIADRPIPTWKQWFGKHFSYPIVGGVVALGIAFGIFVMSQPPSTNLQNADGLLSKHVAEEGASVDRAADSKAKSDANAAAPLASSDDSAKEIAHDTAAANQEQAPATAEKPLADSPQERASAADHPVTDATSNDLSDREEVQQPDNEPENAADEPMPADRRISASEDDDTQENPDLQYSLKMAPLSAPAPEQSVRSNQGLLVAEVVTLEAGRMQVVIKNESNEQIFASTEYEAEQITNIQWSEEDNQLEFDMIHGETQNHILIDVEKKSEVQK